MLYPCAVGFGLHNIKSLENVSVYFCCQLLFQEVGMKQFSNKADDSYISFIP